MKSVMMLALIAILIPASLRAQVTIGPEGPVIPSEEKKQKPDQPQVHEFTITPAPESVPALKYRFDIPLTERTPGNSVPFYYRAVGLVRLLAEHPVGREYEHELEKHLETPIAELDIEGARQSVAHWQGAIDDLAIATYREETDWSWRISDLSGTDSLAFLLGEIQDARVLGRVLALRARVEIAEGRYDDAEQTLRMGYRLSAAIADEPIAICALVGAATAQSMDRAVIDWISRPDSPNIYWALAAVPRPLIDIRPAMEFELSMPHRLAPWLENAATDRVSPGVWQDRIVGLLSQLIEFGADEWAVFAENGSEDCRNLLSLEATILAFKSYPAAKQTLIERGYEKGEVEAMPVGQVLAIQQNYVDQLITDAKFLQGLVATSKSQAVDARTSAMLEARHLIGPPWAVTAAPLPIMSVFPAFVDRTGKTLARSQALRAALRTVEAIRMHVAETGALPSALREIDVVPVPDNPFTDEPFEYSLENGTAILSVIVDDDRKASNWRFELTLAPSNE